MLTPTCSPLFVSIARKLDRLANKLPEQSEYRSTPEAATAAYEKHVAIVAKARPLREACEALTRAFDMYPVGSATISKVEADLGREVDPALEAAIVEEARCALAWRDRLAADKTAREAARTAEATEKARWLASMSPRRVRRLA